MKTTILLIALIGTCVGCYFLDEAKKDALTVVSRQVEELSSLREQNRKLEYEISSLRKKVSSFEEKRVESVEQPKEQPTLSENKPQTQPPRIVKREEPESPVIQAPEANKQEIKNKILELDREIYATQSKLHDKEREWIIEDSKRGIRTSKHERDELREKVRVYIEQLESQKRELESNL